MQPRYHGCDLLDLDYSVVKYGQITCTVCGRLWQFMPNRGWKMVPETRTRPKGR